MPRQLTVGDVTKDNPIYSSFDKSGRACDTDCDCAQFQDDDVGNDDIGSCDVGNYCIGNDIDIFIHIVEGSSVPSMIEADQMARQCRIISF